METVIKLVLGQSKMAELTTQSQQSSNTYWKVGERRRERPINSKRQKLSLLLVFPEVQLGLRVWDEQRPPIPGLGNALHTSAQGHNSLSSWLFSYPMSHRE